MVRIHYLPDSHKSDLCSAKGRTVLWDLLNERERLLVLQMDQVYKDKYYEDPVSNPSLFFSRRQIRVGVDMVGKLWSHSYVQEEFSQVRTQAKYVCIHWSGQTRKLGMASYSNVGNQHAHHSHAVHRP